MTGRTCRRGAWPGKECWGLVALTDEEPAADCGDGGLGWREAHRAEEREEEEEEEAEMCEDGYGGEEEAKDLEECLEEKSGEEADLPLEELAFESRAQTAASICLTSPLEVQKSDAFRARRREIAAAVNIDFSVYAT